MATKDLARPFETDRALRDRSRGYPTHQLYHSANYISFQCGVSLFFGLFPRESSQWAQEHWRWIHTATTDPFEKLDFLDEPIRVQKELVETLMKKVRSSVFFQGGDEKKEAGD